MVKLSYSEQLKHPNWQRRRLERLEVAGWLCEACSAGDLTLHVHHKQYFKGRLAWEYSDAELAVLCEGCHAEQHERNELLLRILVSAGLYGMDGFDATEPAIGLVGGYFAGSLCGQIDADLTREAQSASPVYFDLGVAMAALSLAPRRELASVIRGVYEKNEFDIGEQVAQLLERWERTA